MKYNIGDKVRYPADWKPETLKEENTQHSYKIVTSLIAISFVIGVAVGIVLRF